MAIKAGSVVAVVLTGAAVAGAPWCSLFTKDKAGTIHPGWFLAQAACVLAAAAIPFIAGLISKRNDLKARVKARLQITRSLGPILWSMMQHTIKDGEEWDSEIISLVTNAAANIVGPAGEDLQTRCCYYELVEIDGVPTLEFRNKVGRDDQVMTQFDLTSERGKHALELIKNPRTILVENVKTRRRKKRALIPPGWSDDGDTSYKTFIAAGVQAPGTAYGMLTVDAPKPGDLSKYDESVVNFLGLLLALGKTIPDALAKHITNAAERKNVID